ncbi:hypothetical protein [Cupriavidus basilensis]|uniref:hypothetical protein n=1 Tax=Cupriavidus basilensis TaxID=68895 RepID=UPI00157A5E39|nr:hypothetical protein [Cupriavidus basilensis]NUA30263.1 hypothetical protein [Cupriavidus basilensis]
MRTDHHAYAVLSFHERHRSPGRPADHAIGGSWAICPVALSWTTHEIAAALRVALDTAMPTARWPDGVSSGGLQRQG